MGKTRKPRSPGHGMRPKVTPDKPAPGGIGWCEDHQKVWFPSRRMAKQFLRYRFPAENMNIYRCEIGWWHIGHLLPLAKSGDATRDGLHWRKVP